MKQEQRSSNMFGIIMGIAIIVVGVGLTVGNFAGVDLGNIWMIFVVVPALFLAYMAIQTRSASYAIAAVSTMVVAAILVLGLDWGKAWPLFMAIGGFSLLATMNSQENRA